MQPGRQEGLDVAAAAWAFQPRSYRPSLDDHEGGQVVDSEPLDQIWSLLLGDVQHLKRRVVPAPLKHLSEETLDTPAVTRHG
jgi:hypothetical protein